MRNRGEGEEKEKGAWTVSLRRGKAFIVRNSLFCFFQLSFNVSLAHLRRLQLYISTVGCNWNEFDSETHTDCAYVLLVQYYMILILF